MSYNYKKNFDKPKPEKVARQEFLTSEQVKILLDVIIKTNSKYMRRDHCAIFLGYYLGLRVGEVCLLSRDTFRNIDDNVAHIRTLKSAPRIRFICSCHKAYRLSVARVGKEFTCAKCNKTSIIANNKEAGEAVPEKEPPVIESFVVNYIKEYLKFIPEKQFYLITSSQNTTKYLSREQMRHIFNSYLILAKLDIKYSWHSLRHGRGVLIWERFEDLQMVKEMLRQKSISSAEKYIHMSPQSQAKLRSALEKDNKSDFTFGDK